MLSVSRMSFNHNCDLLSPLLVRQHLEVIVHVVETDVLADAYAARIVAQHSVFHVGPLNSIGLLLCVVGLRNTYTVERAPLWTSILKRYDIAVLVYFLLKVSDLHKEVSMETTYNTLSSHAYLLLVCYAVNHGLPCRLYDLYLAALTSDLL